MHKKSIVRFCLWAIVILGLVACTKLRFGYEYADWLFIYSVEDNFDLEKEQRAKMKLEVSDYFKWHQKKMLPIYSDFLNQLATQTKRGIKLSQVDSGAAKFQEIYRMTLDPMIPKAQFFLGSLSDEQVESWLLRQKKKNQKMRKDMSGSAESQYERRYGKIIKELEDWTGRLSKDQKAQIKILNSTLPWNGMLWLECREKNQSQLANLLQQKAPHEVLKKFLENYYLHPEKLRTLEYEKRNKDYELKMKAMIVSVYNLLTTEQRTHFIEAVEKLSLDFHNLSLED